MHALVMLIILDIHLLLFKTTLKCFQKIWLEPGVKELLYFLITFLNSFLEKLGHSNESFNEILSNNHMFT